MDTTDRESLVRAATQCGDCVGWLEHCEAECCRVFTFSVTPRSDVVRVGDTVRIHTQPLNKDAERYYELHGAVVESGAFVVVPQETCEFTPTRLLVRRTCSALRDDCLCDLHDGRQPSYCADFTCGTSTGDDWVVTPRCLFAFKDTSADPRPDEKLI
jgi:hypothetical protein